MFNTLFAVCLLVNDFETSVAFYRDTLGLTVNYTEGKFANFKLQGTELAIFQKNAATAMFPAKFIKPTGGFLIGFQVDDLAKTCAELAAKGVTMFEGPKQTAWGQKVAYFHDPDANIWELSQKDTQ